MIKLAHIRAAPQAVQSAAAGVSAGGPGKEKVDGRRWKEGRGEGAKRCRRATVGEAYIYLIRLKGCPWGIR